ncbi:MAG: helix-turn-helix transcriptional regulator [Bacteroidetes bacterium]|nr:helix-turn-helix transcriptional regulator [Bacteroidota bacterium]
MGRLQSSNSSPCYFWYNKAAIFYASGVTSMHRHNTMQIVFDIQRNFRCRLKHGEWKNCNCVIIKESAPHQLNTNDSVQLIIYLDPTTEIAHTIKHRYLGENDISCPDLGIFQITNTVELQKSIVSPDPFMLERLVSGILIYLSGKHPHNPIDQRVALVEQTIALSHPDDFTSKNLAEKVYLSESRLRSLFKEVTGVSLHRYSLSSRMRVAVNQIIMGNTIRDAAIKAGFTDGSHLQKMMLKHYGISPSRFIKEKLMSADVNLDPTPLRLETTVC